MDNAGRVAVRVMNGDGCERCADGEPDSTRRRVRHAPDYRAGERGLRRHQPALLDAPELSTEGSSPEIPRTRQRENTGRVRGKHGQGVPAGAGLLGGSRDVLGEY